MDPPKPAFGGGWITGRFRGQYAAAGVERRGPVEVRTVRLLRGTLEAARFSAFGPSSSEPRLHQPHLDELYVAAGSGDDGFPIWQRLAVIDVSLFAHEKIDDDLLGGTSLGEIAGELWARIPD